MTSDPVVAVVVFQSYVLTVPAEFNQVQRKAYQSVIRKTFERLQAAGKKVAVIGDVPGHVLTSHSTAWRPKLTHTIPAASR